MRRSSEQPPASAPLVVRWHGVSLEAVRAGRLVVAAVELENAGSLAWTSDGPRWIYASYHWLDSLGNAIVWDGLHTPLPRPIHPGERVQLDVPVRAPLPPGRYRLALDLLDAERLWFSEVGNRPLEVEIDVRAGIERRALAVQLSGGSPELVALTRRALAAQSEAITDDEGAAEAVAHLAAGCAPASDWVRRILDAHSQGYAVVGGSVRPQGGLLGRRRAAALAPWAPGGGRNPAFGHPLLCPSLLHGIEAEWLPELEGLPAVRPPSGEPWLYDGRITLTAPPRFGRRRG